MLPSNRHFVCKIQSKCIDEKFFLASQSALSASSFTGRGITEEIFINQGHPHQAPPAVRPGWGGGHPRSGTSDAGEQPGPHPHYPAFPVTDFSFFLLRHFLSFHHSLFHEHGNA